MMIDRTRNWQPSLFTRLDKAIIPDIIWSAVYLALSFLVNFYAGSFATKHTSNSVTDLLLDNLPVVRVDIVFIEGSLLLWLFVCALLLCQPERIPFVLKSVALFVLVRSAFIVLTHLGPFPERSTLDANEIIQLFTFGSDLFFSGHTGAPFLLALIFWKQPVLRAFFLGASALFGISVLVGHLHYSIDVFAAFFITYGIFDMAKFLFAREHVLFENAGGARGSPDLHCGRRVALHAAQVDLKVTSAAPGAGPAITANTLSQKSVEPVLGIRPMDGFVSIRPKDVEHVE